MMRKQLLTLKSLAGREAAQCAPRARRREVNADDALLVRGHYDYADAFEIETLQSDTRKPQQLFRAALTRAPSFLRLVPIVHKHVLRFRLGPSASPDHLLGWRAMTSFISGQV